MGFKQGYAMVTSKPQMLEMFSKWKFSSVGVMIFGAISILCYIDFVSKKIVCSNFLIATTILLIICFHLSDRDLKGAAIKPPFSV